MKKKIVTICILLTITLSDNLFAQTAAERQREYLKEIQTFNIKQRFRENTRRVTVHDSTWDDWLKRTGELPPDFSQLPSAPFLPEPLAQVRNGKEIPITARDEWNRKREEIKTAYQHWVSGRFPPAPDNLTADILSEKTEDSGTLVQLIRLRFGPGLRATMTVELIIPPGNGPFPVFMAQWNHREWAQLAVKRGYIGCVYAAADNKDDTEQYLYLYPEYDFSALMRRAWGASRVIDYLQTRAEVHKKQISLSGHSRNGKQSLWAAAFDDRIAAVVSSSSSTGGDAPWRLGDPQYASETLDYVTALNGHWFHPRLRFFFGREDKLPIDQNLLAALIAPRALLFHYSIVERGLNSWANEQNYYSVKKVYDFLQVPDAVGVHTRMGEHAVAARDIEATIDFLDIQFGRSAATWNNVLYYPYRFSDWVKTPAATRAAAAKPAAVQLQEQYADTTAFRKDKETILRNLSWLLGDEPAGVRAAKVGTWDSPRQDWMDNINPRPEVKGAKSIHLGPYTSIGDHIEGRLYCPADASGKIKIPPGGTFPVIIYSHQYAHSTGYAKGYDKDGRPGTAGLFEELIRQGFAVLAIDLFGFGTRIEEATRFYDRQPQWSKMGKMVRDLRSCIDAVEDIDYLDDHRVYLLGNTLGGAVSLIAAALDQRVAGVAVVAAASPWRASNSRYESLRTYSHFHGFIPRLGFFADKPQEAPVDFGEIIAAAAPKPMLIIAPDRDRYTDTDALKKMMTPVNNVYSLFGKSGQLVVQHPREINRMTREMYREVGIFFSGLERSRIPGNQTDISQSGN